MRKIFATLKSVVAAALVVSMTLAVSCSYDDTAVKKDIKNLKGDLAKLTERVVALENAAKAQAPTLEELLDGKAVIVEVTTNENGDQIIKLSNGKEITVLAPASCECDEPLQYRVVDGVLEVSADGTNWVAINGVAAEQVVADVVINEDGTATIKLANGEEFTVGVAELIEFEATRTQVYVKAGETKEIAFAINDAVEDINVMNQPLGWKATVNAATRAAGGQDYVLAVTAPKSELLASGIAEKEGEVLVHFNTAAGACKVLKLAVNIAELTIAVDKEGNITITNSVLDFYQGQDPLTWEPYEYENFATWYLGLIPLEYFNGTITEADFENSIGSYDRMFGANELPYVDGEYELQVINTSVQNMLVDIAYRDLTETESFAVFVVPFVDGGRTPDFDSAITALFKQTYVNIEAVEEGASYNDVELNATLMGAEKYHILCISETEAYNEFEGIEGYVEQTIMFFQYDHLQFYNTIERDIISEEVSLSELVTYGIEDANFEILPNETYHFVVLPIEDLTKAYTEYTVEDFIFFEFATTDIVEATEPIALTVTRNEEETSIFNIQVDVEYDAAVVDYVYYQWFDNEQLEITKEDIFANGYRLGEWGPSKDCDGPEESKVLVLLAVNKNGEYEITQHTFASKGVVYSDREVAIEEVTFEGKFINVKLSGVGEDDFSVIRYYAETVEKANTDPEFLAPLEYTGITMSKTAYTNPFSGQYVSSYTWDNFVEGNTYFLAVSVTFNDGTVSHLLTGEYEYPEPEPVDVVATGAAARFDANNAYATIVDFQLPNEETASVAFRTGDGGWDMDLCFSKGLNYINAGQWNTFGDKGDSTVWYTNVYLNGNQAEVKGAIEVGYADGAYSFTFRIGLYNITYTGAVEGLVEPEVTSADLEQPDGGEVVDRTGIEFTLYTGEGKTVTIDPGVGYCAMDLVDAEGKNYIRFEFNESGAYPVSGKTYTFSPSDTSYNFGTLSGNGVYVGLDGWVQAGIADYGGIVPTSGTITVSSVENDVYTFVLDFVLPDGSKFGGTYVGALPF